ncbi:FAD binding domain-containing protein [Butyricicoccus sp.]|uniref:FAD binding domain-containing protein n=1 Tax=Butyricicoccus sp. TaxID=2049021 RepID=UPI0037364026
MYTIRQFLCPSSLEEAYQALTAARNNTVLGGCMWLRLGRRAIGTAIDLSALGLDRITDTGDTIEIGAMVSLRQLETSKLLRQQYGTLFRDAVSGIVGTQFRNTATVGGSVFGRFGFSDVLTALLALPAQVKLYHRGTVSIEEFAAMPYEKDILECIILPKQAYAASYQHMRFQATDFPVLTCAVSCQDGVYRVSVGARPQKACLAYSGQTPDAQAITDSLNFSSNMRASADYRRKICPVLIRRALEEVQSCK